MSQCFSLLIGRGVLDEYGDAEEEHADSKDTARLGHFLEQLKHPWHDLLVAIWQDQYCVQGRIGRQRPKGRLHLLVHCLVETSATAEQHAGIRANSCLHLVASFGISESDVTHGIFRKLWISSPALAQGNDQRTMGIVPLWFSREGVTYQ